MQAPTAKPGLDEMFCWSCGTIIKKAAEICVHCGVRVNRAAAQPTTAEYSEKSRVTAGVLGIILGGLGVHRFYLGYIGIGILQIIVSIVTLGIGSFWGFIEGVMITTGANFRDGRGKPLKPYNVQ
jgi:TM2 domain-containing membrane protein YozV